MALFSILLVNFVKNMANVTFSREIAKRNISHEWLGPSRMLYIPTPPTLDIIRGVETFLRAKKKSIAITAYS
jgi:hypothetical protein